QYIVAALKHNLEVITEKPMVIDGKQAQEVMEAERNSKGRVRVAHNYRYTPLHMGIKKLIMSGRLGKIVHAQMIYQLDTFHGSSYFARWNREREMSGGLTITKGCHHFDLLNWWLNDEPEEVFAYGARNYYGANSPHDPALLDGKEYDTAEKWERSPYRRRWNIEGVEAPKDDHLGAHEAAFTLPMTKQYPKKLGIYDKEINIEDTCSAVIRYKGGASATYSLNASSPWEGYVLGIHGTHGRLETIHYTAPSRCPFPAPTNETITFYSMFGEREIHDIRHVAGGHGGADDVLKYEMFVKPSQEATKLHVAAGSRDGALAVAIGEGIWRSVAENKPVKISDLLGESK
ncbi:MAG: Gfo/Idh/MocA family oxidoreductase, partial [Chthoniobacterales bacterium]